MKIQALIEKLQTLDSSLVCYQCLVGELELENFPENEMIPVTDVISGDNKILI